MSEPSAARGAKATLVGQWLKFGVQLLATVVLARLLLPADFGLFSMVVAITGLASLLGDFGLSSATMQARQLTNQQRSNLFWINVSIGALCTITVWAAAPLIAELYRQPLIVDVARTLAPVFILQGAVSQLTANAARAAKYRSLAAVDVSAQIVGFLIAGYLALAGKGVLALVGQQLAVAAWTVSILLIGGRWCPQVPRSAPMRALLRFGTNSFLVQLLTYVSSNVDSVVIGRYWGAASLGLYDRAYQLFRMPIQQIASPLTRVVLPVLSKRQDDRQWVSLKLVEIQRLMAYVIGGLFVFAAASAPSVIEVLLGSNWLPSAPIFGILALGGFFQAIGYVYYWSFLITNKTGLQLKFSIVTRTLMVLLILGGVSFGPLGVAVGVALGLLANWVVLSLGPMKHTGLNVRDLVVAAIRPVFVHIAANAPGYLLSLSYSGHFPALYLLLLQIVSVLCAYLLVGLCYEPLRKDVSCMYALLRKAL